jgi:hypothetical protein
MYRYTEIFNRRPLKQSTIIDAYNDVLKQVSIDQSGSIVRNYSTDEGEVTITVVGSGRYRSVSIDMEGVNETAVSAFLLHIGSFPEVNKIEVTTDDENVIAMLAEFRFPGTAMPNRFVRNGNHFTWSRTNHNK